MSPARLILVRLGFMLGCVLPTMLVVAWASRHASPRFWAAQQTEWEERLAQRLGLGVTIEKVAYPTIYLARLSGVKLVDPETKAEIASIRAIDLWQDDDGWSIDLSQPQIALAQFPAAWKQLHDRLFRQAACGVRCIITAGELTLQGEADSQTLVELQAAWEPTSGSRSPPRGEGQGEGPRASLTCRLAGVPSPKPLTLIISRERNVSPPATRWQFDTAGAAVPCLPAADDLAFLAALGEDCRFSGKVDVVVTERGLSGALKGRFQPVDFEQLMTELPHKLKGKAEVVLDQARFADGKLEQLRGTVESKGGYVSRSFIEAAVKHLGMHDEGVRPASTTVSGAVSYRRMAFGFEMNSEGLVLRGSNDGTQDCVLISAAAGPILLEPDEKQIPLARLLRALSASDDQALASQPLEALRRILPLPAAPAPFTPGVRLRPSVTKGQAISEPGLE